MQVMTTLGVDYSAKNLPGPGQTSIRLNLWDVAGGVEQLLHHDRMKPNFHDRMKPRPRALQSSLSSLPSRLPGSHE